jgi:hypothetical protein
MKVKKLLTRTALIMALTLGFQYLGPFLSIPPPASNILIGSLVNASLAAAAVLAGAWGGVAISVAAPVAALMQQQIAFPWLVPIIAGGNAVYVLLFGWWYNRDKSAAVLLASGAKFLLTFLPVSTAVDILVVPRPEAEALSLMFGWPQLIAAILGGAAAIPIIKRMSEL